MFLQDNEEDEHDITPYQISSESSESSTSSSFSTSCGSVCDLVTPENSPENVPVSLNYCGNVCLFHTLKISLFCLLKKQKHETSSVPLSKTQRNKHSLLVVKNEPPVFDEMF